MTVAQESARIFAANRAVGRIELAAQYGRGITRPARVHEAGSLRVRFPGARKRELEAVVINTAGGITGGDRFDLDIAAGEAARLTVTSAAAEKVYRSLGPDAHIRIRLTAGAAASLAWLPQETILFDGARLARTIDVELAADARLIMVEALVLGRTGMGEAVEHGLFADRWRVRRGGALIYAESVRLDGAIAAKLGEPAVANGGAAVATVLVVPGDADALAPLRALKRLRGEVATSAWNGIAVARLCARDGAALRYDLTTLIATLRGGKLPHCWFH
ncbi:MAG TPA: urease accessory protein UreD [Xanthobacteraceae bacterium]|nr:urease accessory protein UreD [Xanthobacteraceae bacterium]